LDFPRLNVVGGWFNLIVALDVAVNESVGDSNFLSLTSPPFCAVVREGRIAVDIPDRILHFNGTFVYSIPGKR